jgi:Domain of unknown function (DUF4386)
MKSLRFAGLSLIVTSLGFVVVFAYLARHFGYPEVLRGSAAQVLPVLVAGGSKLRAVWAVYALLPIGLAVAARLLRPLLFAAGERAANWGTFAGSASAVAMMLGLARWPTLNHELGARYLTAPPAQQQRLATWFDAGNLVLGNALGELCGELLLSAWFLALGLALVRGSRAWRLTGYFALFTALSMVAGSLRNLTHAVAPLAVFDNTLLPVFLVTLGCVLLLSPASS